MIAKKLAPVVLAGALLLSACSSSAPDVSTQGQVNYACALTEMVNEHFDQDSDAKPQFDTLRDPILTGYSSIGALLGAPTGGRAGISEELKEVGRDTYYAMSSLAESGMEDAIEAMAEFCDSDSDAKPRGDVSNEGRINYACALIDDIEENEGPVREWDLAIGESTSPGQIKAVSAGALVGGATGGTKGVPDAMSDAGTELFKATAQVNGEMLQEGIDALSSACEAR